MDDRKLEATDLVCHSILTRAGTRPHRAREPLYTPREIEWQQLNIPKMLEAGVITYTSSPWSAKSQFVVQGPGKKKLEAIRDYPTPELAEEVDNFLL